MHATFISTMALVGAGAVLAQEGGMNFHLDTLPQGYSSAASVATQAADSLIQAPTGAGAVLASSVASAAAQQTTAAADENPEDDIMSILPIYDESGNIKSATGEPAATPLTHPYLSSSGPEVPATTPLTHPYLSSNASSAAATNTPVAPSMTTSYAVPGGNNTGPVGTASSSGSGPLTRTSVVDGSIETDAATSAGSGSDSSPSGTADNAAGVVGVQMGLFGAAVAGLLAFLV